MIASAAGWFEALVLATSVPSRVGCRLGCRGCRRGAAGAACCDVPRSLTSAGRSLSDSWLRRYSCPKNMMKTRVDRRHDDVQSRQNELREDIQRDFGALPVLRHFGRERHEIAPDVPARLEPKSPVGKRREFAASFVRMIPVAERRTSDALFRSSRMMPILYQPKAGELRGLADGRVRGLAVRRGGGAANGRLAEPEDRMDSSVVGDVESGVHLTGY